MNGAGGKRNSSGQELRPDKVAAVAVMVQAEARRLGFDLIGSAPLDRVQGQPAAARYRTWLEKGFQGEMAYLARADAVVKREDATRIQEGLQWALVVGVNYHTVPLDTDMASDASRGLLARYAWGEDYHDVLLPRLGQMAAHVEDLLGTEVPGEGRWRAYVDTGPVLERDLAARAGLGFIGKNTSLITPRLGSWLFLGEILTTRELPLPGEWLEPEPEFQGSCGACTRCLEACPTGALVAPYQLDARRCISYLTIELKGPIPRELRPMMGNRIFGCDICQEVCPWNRRFARSSGEPSFQPRAGTMAPGLLDLMALDEEGFRARFQASPVKRAKRRGLLRNVAVALGNWADPAALPVLGGAVKDPEPLIRGHAAWALGRLDDGAGTATLRAALQTEADGWVREEIAAAL